jgi:hypothetical protein
MTEAGLHGALVLIYREETQGDVAQKEPRAAAE